MEKITEQDIDFFKERKESRLLREYYEHKEKRIDNLINIKKNLSSAHNISVLLKEKQDDIDLLHSKKVVLEYCLEIFKSIKKEDLAIEDSERKINNNKRVTNVSKEEPKQEISDKTNEIHEEIKLVLNRYYESKEC